MVDVKNSVWEVLYLNAVQSFIFKLFQIVEDSKWYES